MAMLTDMIQPELATGTTDPSCDCGPFAAGAARPVRPLDPMYAEPAAPDAVPGPDGRPLTLAMLPPPETKRWVVRRKAEVLAAINGGLLSTAEACARYRLSPEELELWQKAIDRAGVPGLRVTRIQLYRDDYGQRAMRRPVQSAPPHIGASLSAQAVARLALT